MTTPAIKMASSAEQNVTPSVPKIPLTVLIRSLNEEDRIGDAIKSTQGLGAEIVVVDACSKDKTVEVAKPLGAKVFTNPWPGFGPQRYWGEERCGNDFILSLDSDEHLTPAIIAEIRAQFAKPNPPRLMIVRKAMVFPHHKKPPPLGFCHEQVLIYDRRIARTGPNPNWDKLEISVSDKPHTIRNPLWHFSFRDWNHAIAKSNYVAQLAAETQIKKSAAELTVRLILEFPFSFIKFYFFRRYCLGGADGFIMAMVSAFGRFIRIAKMLERAKYG